MMAHIRKQDPLKQGLKQTGLSGSFETSIIRKQDPLKQGLKLTPNQKSNEVQPIRKQDPLKQGLKPHLMPDHVHVLHSKARSTKTRIETRSGIRRNRRF